MTTTPSTIFGPTHSDTILRWINRGIESLWILAVLLVPLAFLDRQYAISEAVIAYVEVPKVALLRTLAGLIAILWLLEWCIGNRSNSFPSLLAYFRQFQLRALFENLTSWLRAQPIRWLWLAVWFYFATFLLGTIFSASFSVSLWGEVPGQDGYSAYTIVAYTVLFGAIATHLKTKSQLWRLLGAIIVMGVLVSGYSMLQRDDHDFLNLTEISGGGISRTTSIAGNAIFAAAVMSMTIPISLFAAAASLRDREKAGVDLIRKWREWMPTFLVAGLWVLILTIQLIGITYTFSRGPWLGAISALATIGGMTLIFAGWSTLGRVAAVETPKTAATLAVVQWDISVYDLRLWLAGALTLAGLISIAALFGWRIFGRSSLVIGVVAVIAAAVVLGPSWFSDGLDTVDNQASSGTRSPSFTETPVAQRISSIQLGVSSGVLGGRIDTWHRSWELIRDRPWFEFDDLSFPWIRPFLGYGPDLFRYTYLLRSVPQGGGSPAEPDHAHNYFITHAVDLGILGFLSSLGIFAAVFVVGGYFLIWQRNSVPPILTLVLIGVVATLVGRSLEMMVGLARVSDLTILWAVLGIFAALPAIIAHAEEEAPPQPSRQNSRRRSRAPQGPPKSTFAIGWPSFLRLAIAAWLIGGIGTLIWVKNVNYVRASIDVGEAVEHYRNGDFQASLTYLDKAIDLAPDVSPYYNYRAQVYFAYQVIGHETPEAACSRQTEIPYGGCLNVKSFESNVQGANKRPFYYRSRLALANSALNLKQDEIAIRLFDEVLTMVPNSEILRYDIGTTYIELAEAYISSEVPDLALAPLGKAMRLFDPNTKRAESSAKTQFVQGIALRDLGRLPEAAESIELSLKAPFSKGSIGRAHKVLAEIYAELGREQSAADHRASTEEIVLDLLNQRQVEAKGRRRQVSNEDIELALELTIVDDTRLQAHRLMVENNTRSGNDESAAEHENRVKQITEALFQMGVAAQNDGRLQEAAESLALSFKHTNDLALIIQANDLLLPIFDELGPSQLYEDHLSQALSVATNLKDRGKLEVAEARHLKKQGKIEQQNDSLLKAADFFELSLQLTEDPELRSVDHTWLKQVYTRLGNTKQAEEHNLVLNPLVVAESWVVFAESNVGKSQTGRTLELIEDALPVIRDNLGDPQLLARALYVRGIFYRELDRPADAAASFQESIESQLIQPSLARAHKHLSEIYDELGQAQLAQKHLAVVERGALDQLAEAQAEFDIRRTRESIAFLNVVLELTAVDDTRLQAYHLKIDNLSRLGDDESQAEPTSQIKQITEGLFQKGVAARNDGRLQQAAESLVLSFKYTMDTALIIQANDLLLQIFDELGPSQLYEDHLSQALSVATNLKERGKLEVAEARELKVEGKIEQQNNALLKAADLFKLSLKLTEDPELRSVNHTWLKQVYTKLGDIELAEYHGSQAQS